MLLRSQLEDAVLPSLPYCGGPGATHVGTSMSGDVLHLPGDGSEKTVTGCHLSILDLQNDETHPSPAVISTG